MKSKRRVATPPPGKGDVVTGVPMEWSSAVS
jgi:hypothetical protein